MSNWEVRCWSEFSVEKFGLNHDEPELFVTSQWEGHLTCWRRGYVIYRVGAIALWLVAISIMSFTSLSSFDPGMGMMSWFLYLRHWALLVVAVDAIYQAATTLNTFIKSNGLESPYPSAHMPIHLKAQWVISNIALGIGLFASIVEGTVFYSGSLTEQPLDVFPLIILPLYVIVDLYITARPIRLFHFFHPMAYAFLYTGMAMLIQYTTEMTAHPLLDWSNPLFVGLYTGFGFGLGLFVIWLMVYGLYRTRLLCSGTTENNKDNDEEKPYDPFK